MTTQLEEIAPECIDRNPENPRQHFREAGLNRLAESIEESGGVLVPLYVYRDPDHDGRYRLIDGERRWLTALRLGVERVPALVRDDPPDPAKNIVEMFNIHKVREDWEDMPTALALRDVMRRTGEDDPEALTHITGLSREQIGRYKLLLDLPQEYQDMVNAGDVPMNFFVELDRNVIKPLVRERTSLAEEFDEATLRKSFLEKRQAGALPDLISLRKVKPIIKRAASDAGSASGASQLDAFLRQLFTNTTTTVDEVYDESVAFAVEIDKIIQRTRQLPDQLVGLLDRIEPGEERERVLDSVRTARDAFDGLLQRFGDQ
jgi:ParB family chromosome partitioning protein